MPATVTKVEIINWALTEIGVGPVFSTEDTSELALSIENTWQRTVDHAFSVEEWNWTRQTRKLERQAAVPINGWRYGYDLPADRVGPAVAYLDQAGSSRHLLRNFHIEGATVFADVDQLWAEIRVIVAIDDWPVDFRAAFTKLLASELAVPVLQDDRMKEAIRAMCFGSPAKEGTGGLFGRLMGQNKAADPIGNAPLTATDPLDDARYGAMNRDSAWAGRYA